MQVCNKTQTCVYACLCFVAVRRADPSTTKAGTPTTPCQGLQRAAGPIVFGVPTPSSRRLPDSSPTSWPKKSGRERWGTKLCAHALSHDSDSEGDDDDDGDDVHRFKFTRIHRKYSKVNQKTSQGESSQKFTKSSQHHLGGELW